VSVPQTLADQFSIQTPLESGYWATSIAVLVTSVQLCWISALTIEFQTSVFSVGSAKPPSTGPTEGEPLLSGLAVGEEFRLFNPLEALFKDLRMVGYATATAITVTQQDHANYNKKHPVIFHVISFKISEILD